MNTVSKVSSFPIHKLLSSTIYSRGLGLGAQAVASTNYGDSANVDSSEIIQVSIPAELKQAFGFDTCFIETRGDQILAVAATKKLLMEEKLRKSLLSLNVPLSKIIHDSSSQVSYN